MSRAFLGRKRLSSSTVDGLGMRDEHRHADAGRRQLDLRVEDLLGLDHHLPFLLGRAVLHEDVDVGNDVEGDPLGNFLTSIGSLTKTARVWAKSSSIAALPAPETDW
jgi:hypothetical protein